MNEIYDLIINNEDLLNLYKKDPHFNACANVAIRSDMNEKEFLIFALTESSKARMELNNQLVDQAMCSKNPRGLVYKNDYFTRL